MDWGFLEQQFGAVYSDGPGSPPLPTRLMAGLSILKYSENLSDERLWRRVLPAQVRLRPLVADALAPEDGRGAAQRVDPGEPCGAGEDRGVKPSELAAVVVDTTVQPKNVAHPTEAELLNRAREWLGRARQEAWRRFAPVLCQAGQARAHRTAALRPCEADQAREQAFENAQDLSWPRDPRHPAQDRRR